MAKPLTFSVTELKCYVCINAPPRSGRNSCGRSYEHNEPQPLISWQAEDVESRDILSVLAKSRLRIMVDESGGQIIPSASEGVQAHFFFQWDRLFVEKI
jgi:hypothetical protein